MCTYVLEKAISTSYQNRRTCALVRSLTDHFKVVLRSDLIVSIFPGKNASSVLLPSFFCPIGPIKKQLTLHTHVQELSCKLRHTENVNRAVSFPWILYQISFILIISHPLSTDLLKIANE